jgi:hypothetical protein
MVQSDPAQALAGRGGSTETGEQFALDPIGDIIQNLARDERRLPDKPKGDPALLHGGVSALSEKAVARLKGYLGSVPGFPIPMVQAELTDERRHRNVIAPLGAAELADINRHRSIVRTATRPYENEDDLHDLVRESLGGFGAPDRAFLCFTTTERQRFREVVHNLMEQEETFGLQLAEPPVLVIEQAEPRQFQEVVLLPEVSFLTAQIPSLFKALGVPRVGLHYALQTQH